jgi:hypothetical protein
MKLLISIILVTISSFTSFAQQKTRLLQVQPDRESSEDYGKETWQRLDVILAASTKRTEGFSNPHIQSGQQRN